MTAGILRRKTIRRFSLELKEESILKMPEGAEVLSAQASGRGGMEIIVFAAVDPDIDVLQKEVTFLQIPCGQQYNDREGFEYLATVQQDFGSSVKNIFTNGTIHRPAVPTPA